MNRIKRKIKWKVQPAPTGDYASFQTRGWPNANFDGEPDLPAAQIFCSDDYYPARVKTGEHAELLVQVADHSVGGEQRFSWRTLKTRAKTLADAKSLVEEFYRQHPAWVPKSND